MGRWPAPPRGEHNQTAARRGMNGLVAAEKPHRRHDLTKGRASPDLIQLHYRGKTKEIRPEPCIAGGCHKHDGRRPPFAEPSNPCHVEATAITRAAANGGRKALSVLRLK
jgi:hypothetical protein